MSNAKPTGVVAAVQRDHRDIEKMLDEVEKASGTARREAFERLATKLKAHEEAEDEVVHPLAKEEGAGEKVDHLEDEEDEASQMLTRLQKMDCDSDEFTRLFAELKQDVLHHAQEEEKDEHTRIMRDTPPDELERRGEMFEAAEDKAAKK
jgi:hemerythrin superfamily protein